MKYSKTKFVCTAGVIAALYVVLTLLSGMFGLSSAEIQLRFSEALVALALFTSAAVPGITIGCFFANILSGLMVQDVIFGSAASFIGVLGAYLIGRITKKKAPKLRYLFILPNIAANTVIIPLLFKYVYHLGEPVLIVAFMIFLGEAISTALGIPLMLALEHGKVKIFS